MATDKPYNGGTWTRARYWQQVRSHLRNAFKFAWVPIRECKTSARRKNQSSNKRLKYEYQCNHCSEWFPDKEIAVDHIEPVGSLKSEDDLVLFLKRLTPEDGFQVLCKPCHQIKTNEERKK